MIGWWIVISTQTPEERRQAVDRKAFILATWEVGLGGLCPRLLADQRHRRLLAAQRECRLPFAIAAVEQAERRTVGAPHDVAQIMRLRLVERRFDTGREAGFDKESREAHGVIVAMPS